LIIAGWGSYYATRIILISLELVRLGLDKENGNLGCEGAVVAFPSALLRHWVYGGIWLWLDFRCRENEPTLATMTVAQMGHRVWWLGFDLDSS
jgi:hypothetical protein